MTTSVFETNDSSLDSDHPNLLSVVVVVHHTAVPVLYTKGRPACITASLAPIPSVGANTTLGGAVPAGVSQWVVPINEFL